MEFRAYGFLAQTVATNKHGDGSVITRVFTPEYRAEVITSFILKLFSACNTFISLHSAE